MPSFLARINRQRYRQFTVPVFESDGSTDANLAAGDVAIVRLAHNNVTYLEIRSGQVTDGDSTITFTAGTNDLTVDIGGPDAQDLLLPCYSCEVLVMDASDVDAANSPRIKSCEIGVIHVSGSLPEPPELQSSSSGESSAS